MDLGPELTSRARRRLRHRRKYRIWGLGAGTFVELEANVIAIPLGVRYHYAFLAMLPWCGMWIGETIADLRWIRKHRERTRVAHARSISVSDYVSPVERTVTRGFALLPLLPACALPLLPQHGGSRWVGFAGLLAASLLMIGYMVVNEAVQRWVVSQPQRAASSEELVLEDALRTGTLRSITAAQAMLGAIIATQGFSMIADRFPSGSPAGAIGDVATLIFFFGSIGSLIPLYSRFRSYFHARIWTKP
jgi:hypothetical protein